MRNFSTRAATLIAATCMAASTQALCQTSARDIDAAHLRSYHERLASEPHIAGTPGDHRTIERLEELMRSFGLEVSRQPIWVYLSKPVRASVEVRVRKEPPISLPLKERMLEEDPFSQSSDLTIGFNGYAATGTATGQVVYANYGRLEDFQKLAELGIDCTGRIVIARYGGNFRGYKAKFAQQAGAAGLIIYSDPADSGYVRGIEYPEGGFYNGTSIQRGSLATLEYSGDPLTPFVPATEDAERLDPAEVALPKIPVQPMGWDAAREIMTRMHGPRVPDSWQGGLPAAYRLTGGSDLEVTLSVEQTRQIEKTANVIGEIKGSTCPDEIIVVGCHHDAWGYGASDPLSGMICLLEAARVMGQAAKQGHRPSRTIRFAAWAAEEYGIIGSSEYVEAHADELSRGGVAYINLDMAAMGMNFGAAGTPSLAGLVAAAAAETLMPGHGSGPPQTILEAWMARSPAVNTDGTPRLGDLGGGSDHVGFNCFLAVPSLGLHGSGANGTSYHTNYDDLAWYRKVVGDDYRAAEMVTRMTVAVVDRLANQPVLPIDPSTYAEHALRHLDALSGRVSADGRKSLDQVREAAKAFGDHARPVMELLKVAEISMEESKEVNDRLLQIEHGWSEGFDTGRSWFRSGYASSDQSSGYAAWMLPGLRHAIELGDDELLAERARAYVIYFDRATILMDEIRAQVRILLRSNRSSD